MKSDLLLAVTQLAAERNLPQNVVVSAVEAALASAYKRDPAAGGQDVAVKVNPDNGDVTVTTIKHVVEEVEDPGSQLTVEQAQKLMKGATVGDIIITGSIEHNPGRIAAQTAKQVVMQRLREAERDLVFDEFVDKAGEVLTATVQRIEPRYITVDLGRADAIMPPTEQSPFERYRPGQQLKFYVVDVARTVRGPEIVVSRTHPDLLRRLFEVEVPEIFNGVIEIKSIAREPGSRSKVAVHSNQAGVDAVGACVGLRGIRIQNVVNELLGEKIDVIEWDEDPVKFISNSLSPATVDRVQLDDATHAATVVVPDRQLSLAIGREGQNARLAAKLTNWRIDIQGASAAAAAAAAAEAAAQVEMPSTAAEAEALLDAMAARAEAPAPAQVEAPAAEKAEAAPEERRETVAAPAAEVVDKQAIEKAARQRELDAAAEEQALRALEEELALLERQEAERKQAEAAEAAAIDVASDDLWQVPALGEEGEDVGVLRFAEDIAGFRDSNESRGGRRGRGGSSAKSRRRR